MPGKCLHVRAAVIASDAEILDAHGRVARGDVRWCIDCGAIVPLVRERNGNWIAPSTEKAEQHWLHMVELSIEQALAETKPRRPHSH